MLRVLTGNSTGRISQSFNCMIYNQEDIWVVLFQLIDFERIDWLIPIKEKIKVSSYTARYPVLRTAQSALHFTPWQTYLFQGHFNFSGKHQAMLKLLRKDNSLTYQPLWQPWQRGVIKLAKGSKRPQWNLKPGSFE